MQNASSEHPRVGRANLSAQVTGLLRERLLAGEIPAGERLNEAHWAAQLDVSRTPLREALTILAGEGFLDCRPKRGYFVRSLDADEFADLYQMRLMLDPEALRLAGVPSAARLAALHRLNDKLATAASRRRIDTATVIDLDDEWHFELVAGCPNQILLGLIRQFVARTRRYEHEYLSHQKHLTMAVDQHQQILDALADNDMEQACVHLRANMSSGTEPLLAWLRARSASDQNS